MHINGTDALVVSCLEAMSPNLPNSRDNLLSIENCSGLGMVVADRLGECYHHRRLKAPESVCMYVSMHVLHDWDLDQRWLANMDNTQFLEPARIANPPCKAQAG